MPAVWGTHGIANGVGMTGFACAIACELGAGGTIKLIIAGYCCCRRSCPWSHLPKAPLLKLRPLLHLLLWLWLLPLRLRLLPLVQLPRRLLLPRE